MLTAIGKVVFLKEVPFSKRWQSINCEFSRGSANQWDLKKGRRSSRQARRANAVIAEKTHAKPKALADLYDKL